MTTSLATPFASTAKTDWFSLFNAWKPDAAGFILGTGFYRFTSPLGLDGLARCDDNRLEILAVYTETPGTGQFRQFIAKAKTVVPEICVWEVWNDHLAETLVRYGFKPVRDKCPHTGEMITGFAWKRSEGKETAPDSVLSKS